MLNRFDRYILRETLPPFFLGLLLAAFVLLMNEVLVLADLFIDKGVPAVLIFKILALLVPSILAFSVPLAVLMGVLGALARLSADSETVAFQTLGVSRTRFLRPFLVFGFAGWLLASVLAMFAAPRANDEWMRTITTSVLSRVQLRINPLEFNQSIPDVVFFVEGVARDKSWENVFVYISRDPAAPRVITARRGRLNLYPEKKRATLELMDGAVHSAAPEKPESYSLTDFARLEEEIDVENLFPSLSTEKHVREKDILELVRDAAALRRRSAADPRQLRSYGVEIHKKFALPFACFIFVLVGFPLGLLAGRAGRTAGFSLSLGIILLFYALITAGEKFAMDGRISPFLGMWAPDLLLGACGAWLLLAEGRRWRFPVRFRRASTRDRSAASGPADAKRNTFAAPAMPPALPGEVETTRKDGPAQQDESCAARDLTSGRLSASRGWFRPYFPNVLDRYILRKYVAVWGLVFAGLMAASFLATFFDRLDVVRRLDRPLGLLLQFVWCKTPEFVSTVLPAASLTAALLVLGLMARTNEVTAAKSCGISLFRLLVPILLAGAAASGLAGLVQERLAPASALKAEAVWRKISGLPPRSYSWTNRHWLAGAAGDRLYHYDYFDPASASFSRLEVFDLASPWGLSRRAFAEKAKLAGAGLQLESGWVREFSGGAASPADASPGRILPAAEARGDFLRESKEPAAMTFAELKAYAAEVRTRGFRADTLLVDLAGKFAFPLVSLVMTILAVPFAFFMGKKGTLVGVGLSIVLAMGYWGTFAVFRSLGYAGVLTPFLAAWGANLLFGLAGVFWSLRLRT